MVNLTLRAADGFGPAEVAALSALRTLTPADDGDALRVQLVGLGRPADFPHPLFRAAAVWVSATPFVGPAHIGRRGRDRSVRKAVRKEARRLVAKGDLPAEPTGIEVLPPDRCPIPALTFCRQRDRRADRGADRPGAFLRLTFDRPVAGPVCLGYASHFGLGRFEPAPDPGASGPRPGDPSAAGPPIE